jgi:molybdenum cofactor cytidylyltransferase
MSVAAVILAAGRSTRMGTNKLTADVGGEPLIRRTAEAVLASRARPVVLVTGHEAEKLADAIVGLDLIAVRNQRYVEGLSTSVIAGIAALPEETRAALICLADMALVGPAVLDALIARFEAEPDAGAIVPACEGRWGNPVLLSRKLFGLVATLRADAGARKLLQGRDDVRVLNVEDPAILMDADTPEALQEMRRRIDKTRRVGR